MTHLIIKEILFKNRKIDETTGCWLWTLSKDLRGYGQFRFKGKTLKVHRESFKEFNGLLKEDCLHKPICPNRHCFNPEHLYDGNQFDNMHDVINSKGHYNSNKIYCSKGHKFDYINPTSGSRVCSICRNAYLMEYRKKQKLKKGIK